ncbi:MAG: hypothetical protein Q7K45_06400 [Nanoarchaeota archaeon]|nr:hypothetical protein [Nanoarchaeota archaeon]
MDILLSTEDVERAMTRQGIEHPLLNLLDRYTSDLHTFREQCKELTPSEDRRAYTKNALGFFVDAVEEVKNYAFGPLEMIAVWSKMDDMQLPEQYTLTRAITLAYITLPLSSRGGSNRYFLESGEFLKELFTSAEDIKIYEMRLTEVQDSLKEIDFYCHGVRKTFSELLAGMNLPGGAELISQVIQRTKSSPLIIRLTELHENYSNGIAPLRPNLSAFEF